MTHMVLDCPHCESEKVGFDFIGESRADVDGFFGVSPPEKWNTFLQCRHCNKGVVVELYATSGRLTETPANCPGDPQSFGFFAVAMYPEPQESTAPEHVSAAIASDFVEAVDNLKRGNYTSAGMMFRRVLQRSTTALIPDPASLKSKSLSQRVDMLANSGIITNAMREWATIIRLEGNSAAHGEEEYGETEFTMESATQLHHFTELFLVYAFSLPARVAEYYHGAEELETTGSTQAVE